MKKLIMFFICALPLHSLHASTLNESIAAIEERISGRIGVSVLDTFNQEQWHYNGNERFAMMSTFKTFACAKMLQDSDNGILDKSKKVRIESEKLVTWSPITKKMTGISVEKACEATMVTSDNTAANIVLSNIGGPQAVTDFFRSIEDKVSQLDRIEPDLNQALAGDSRDTTTPNAMSRSLYRVLFDKNVLTESSRVQLKDWMRGNKVSNSLLRSILPEGWTIADRSGTGGQGSRAITAAIWANKRKPLIISIYLTQTELSMPERNSVITEIGKLLFNKYSVEEY